MKGHSKEEGALYGYTVGEMDVYSVKGRNKSIRDLYSARLSVLG